MAEIGFKRSLNNKFGVKSKIDWETYRDEKATDNADLKALVNEAGEEFDPGVSFGIKKTKPRSQWLLVRSSLVDAHEQTGPFTQALCDFSIPNLSRYDELSEVPETNSQGFWRPISSWAKQEAPVGIELSGWVERREFTDDFNAGDSLYHPTKRYDMVTLESDNKGIPRSDLNSSDDD